jgi:hypothetical protein
MNNWTSFHLEHFQAHCSLSIEIRLALKGPWYRVSLSVPFQGRKEQDSTIRITHRMRTLTAASGCTIATPDSTIFNSIPTPAAAITTASPFSPTLLLCGTHLPHPPKVTAPTRSHRRLRSTDFVQKRFLQVYLVTPRYAPLHAPRKYRLSPTGAPMPHPGVSGRHSVIAAI